MTTLPPTVLDGSDGSWVARRWSLWARLDHGGAATFDAEGRLLTVSWRDRYYRRGLDNQVSMLERRGPVESPWAVERLADPESFLREVARATPPTSAATGERATRLASRAQAGLAGLYAVDAAGFRATIGPVPVLPPNHSRAVVFRLTEGCAWNRCRFCTLYSEVPFRTKSAREFRNHVRAVLGWLGDGAGMRPEIYLGEASVLEAGVEPLLEALAVLHEEVRILRGPSAEREASLKGEDPHVFGGIYGFSDVRRAAALPVATARALAEAGVRRLYLGVETGDEAVLRLLAKPHRLDEVRPAVEALHRGGIGAGIILLVGAGGRDHRERHRAAALELLASLDLGRDDFVFLSPLDRRESQGPVAGAQPLTAAELAAETAALGRDLRKATGGRTPVAGYHLESFVY